MAGPTVWLNKHLSNTWEILSIVREARAPEEFRLICSHPRSSYPGRLHCDLFAQEPVGLKDDEYIDYCLDFCQRHGVELFFPGRNAFVIVQARRRFEERGVRILAAAAELTVLQSKALVYAALNDDSIRVPDYAVVNDLAGFDAAWARLRPRHRWLCIKPAVSVYGLGFYVIADHDQTDQRLGMHRSLVLALDEARERLASKGTFRDLLVMQYLPGPERSVDCLARDGELIRCVVRRKGDGEQVLEENAALVAATRRLTARFRLNNLFNVQFRDAAGTSYLLEINPRMSGGLPFACRSGLALPYWALRLALGTVRPEDIPWPQTGIRVPQPVPASSL